MNEIPKIKEHFNTKEWAEERMQGARMRTTKSGERVVRYRSQRKHSASLGSDPHSSASHFHPGPICSILPSTRLPSAIR